MKELNEAYEAGQISSPIQYSEATRLPYLQATIKESMRHFVGGTLPWPRVCPKGGAILGGYYLPQGTLLGVPAYSFHKRAFGPDSDIFKPERWLQGDQEDEKVFRKRTNALHANFMSWGSGVHTCIGRNIAMMEMSKVLSHLFLRYKMKVTPRGPDSPHKCPFGRGLDGIHNGEIWYVQSAWISQQRDFFLDIEKHHIAI